MDIPAEILLPDVYNDDLLMDSLAMHRMDDDGSFAYQSSSSAHLTQHEATSFTESSSQLSSAALVSTSDATKTPGQHEENRAAEGKKQKREFVMKCEVCCRPAVHFHNGVVSCKACNLFFRRAVADLREYRCVQSDTAQPGQCNLAEGKRCNACRLDRCLQLGMDWETVKLPVDVSAEDADRLMTDRKMVLQLASAYDRGFGVVCPNGEDMLDRSLLSDSVDIDGRINRIRFSIDILELHQLYQKSLEDILGDGNNILSYSEKFRMSTASCNRKSLAFPIHKNPKVDKIPPTNMMLDIFLVLEALKAMPFFSKLDLESQKKQVKYVFSAAKVLCWAYDSWIQGSDTVVLPDGMLPIHIGRMLGLADIPKLRQHIFCNILDPMRAAELIHDEFVLVRALIFTTPSNLEPTTQKFLRTEFCRYSKALLQNCQRRLGIANGRRRFDELNQLTQKFFIFGALNSYWASYVYINTGNSSITASFLEECINTHLQIPECWEQL